MIILFRVAQIFAVLHRPGRRIQQVFAAWPNVVVNAHVTFVDVFPADRPEILKQFGILKFVALTGLPANLIVKVHDAVRIGGQLQAGCCMLFSRCHYGKAWKEYEDAVHDRIDESTIRGPQSSLKLHPHRRSGHMCDCTL